MFGSRSRYALYYLASNNHVCYSCTVLDIALASIIIRTSIHHAQQLHVYNRLTHMVAHFSWKGALCIGIYKAASIHSGDKLVLCLVVLPGILLQYS